MLSSIKTSFLKLVGWHTKPLQACEYHLSPQRWPLRLLRSPSLTAIWGLISPTKMRPMTKNHILGRSAWTEFFGWHFYFFWTIILNSNLCKMHWEIFNPSEIVRYGISKLSHDDQHEKTKKMYISDDFFKTLSQRHLQNRLRDFQKSWNYEK